MSDKVGQGDKIEVSVNCNAAKNEDNGCQINIDRSKLLARTPPNEIARRHELFNKAMFPIEAFDLLPVIILVLDENRQVVAANAEFFNHFKGLGLPLRLGLRPGEALNCAHAFDRETGCGTGDDCLKCGAFHSILSAQSGASVKDRCKLSVDTIAGTKEITADVTAAPISVNGENFVILTLTDISNQVRRHQIDRLFFHDLLNTGSILIGNASLLEARGIEDDGGCCQSIVQAANRLIESVNAQRDLAYAQAEELILHLQDLDPKLLLKNITKVFKSGVLGKKLILLTQPMQEKILLRTDPVLLKRVLSNLLLCVAHSSSDGSIVEIGCYQNEDKVTFWFRNRALSLSTEDCQNFRTSFSTAQWCGLGAYTLELITYKCLQGQLNVTNNEGEGTCFTLTIPLTLPGEVYTSGNRL